MKFDFYELKPHHLHSNALMSGTVFDPDFNDTLRPGDGNCPYPPNLEDDSEDHSDDSSFDIQNEKTHNISPGSFTASRNDTQSSIGSYPKVLKQYGMAGLKEEDSSPRRMLEWLVEHGHSPPRVLQDDDSLEVFFQGRKLEY